MSCFARIFGRFVYLCNNKLITVMETLYKYLNEFLVWMGVSPDMQSFAGRAVIIALVVILVGVSFYFCHRILARVVKRLTKKTSATWDDHLFSDRVLTAVCHMLPPIIIYLFLPVAFRGMPVTLMVLSKCCFIYMVFATLHLVNSFITALYRISSEKEPEGKHPLKGVYQMMKLIGICVAVIVVISILVDKNPVVILTGLGAAAAVLSLVFKDTILGFVAGIQLSANDMLRPGDWIEAPKYHANGTVIDVTLTTIKVQNWDKTISTIPPYALVSDSFQNWRGMWDSGGRRVKRSINIDMNTIGFCAAEQLQRYRERGWLKGIDDAAEGEMVNLRVFRNYLEQYLTSHPHVAQDMLMLVRQLQPTPQGLPLELYFFSARQDWPSYEKVQAAVFEHVIAALPEFGLKVFQSPAGTDIKNLS